LKVSGAAKLKKTKIRSGLETTSNFYYFEKLAGLFSRNAEIPSPAASVQAISPNPFHLFFSIAFSVYTTMRCCACLSGFSITSTRNSLLAGSRFLNNGL
jgi:hypothetical protein